MKRWEMVAKALLCSEERARMICSEWKTNHDDEIDLPPARDLGLEIAAAMFMARFGTDYRSWLAEWERLTGRAKEGQ